MRVNNFLQNLVSRKIFLAIASGLLLSLSYNVSALWSFSFFALVPLLFLLKNTPSGKARFFWSFFVGVLYYGSVFLFLFNGHPATWAGIDNSTISFAFITFAWMVCVLTFSFFSGLWGFVSRLVSGTLLSLVSLAALWVVMEYFQALSLSFVSWNTSSFIGFHWTFGHIGYALAEYPRLLSLASLGGVHILSFVVVFFNGLFFRLLTQTKLKRLLYIEAGLSLFILLFISNALFIQSGKALMGAPSVRVASMYTTFGPLAETSHLLSLERKMRVANLFDVILYEEEHPELILLPEYTGYIASLTSAEKRGLVSRMSTETSVVIVDSRRVRSVNNDYNVSVLEFENGDELTQSYTKQLLVPTAEYIPLSIMFLGNMFLDDGWSNSFETKLTLGRGNETIIGKHNELRIGALFCGEVITPQLYRETTQRGANLLVNVASHSLLNSSVPLYNQIIKFSKTRAVENNRFFVQSGNLAPSFVINNRGRLLGETERDENTVLYADVSLLTNTTFANRIGGLWVLLFLLLSLVGLRAKQVRLV